MIEDKKNTGQEYQNTYDAQACRAFALDGPFISESKGPGFRRTRNHFHGQAAQSLAIVEAFISTIHRLIIRLRKVFRDIGIFTINVSGNVNWSWLIFK